MLALLVSFQNFASTLDHAARESGEASDFDAITLVGAAGLHAPQENNLTGSLFHRNVHIFYRGKKFGQLGQFVVMRGEEGARAGVLLKMLDDGPGNGQAIKSRGAAADFVEENETRGRGVI